MSEQQVFQQNSMQKIRRMWESSALLRDVGSYQVSVSHDDGGGIYQEQWCDCDPAIKVEQNLPGQANN